MQIRGAIIGAGTTLAVLAAGITGVAIANASGGEEPDPTPSVTSTRTTSSTAPTPTATPTEVPVSEPAPAQTSAGSTTSGGAAQNADDQSKPVAPAQAPAEPAPPVPAAPAEEAAPAAPEPPVESELPEDELMLPAPVTETEGYQGSGSGGDLGAPATTPAP